jgi:lysozyme
MSINIERLTQQLKVDEGFRDKVYSCSAGKLTIGYGFNLEDNKLPEHIATQLLGYNIGESIADCERFAWFYTLSDVRKEVIINMCYNIGANGISGFKKMITAIEGGDFNEAAYQMMDSKWYHQVGDRAVRLVAMMKEG